MKEFNLRRLLDACCVEIPDEVYNALFDYLLQVDVDLNTVNIDDLYVNSVCRIYRNELKEEHHILVDDDDDEYLCVI